MLEVNIPEIVAEVSAIFEHYEASLVSNDVMALDDLFWDSPLALRYGTSENLHGYAAIQAFRSARSPVGLARTIFNTVITTYGSDMATANTEFSREGNPRTGRQSQTWMRTDRGWKIVSAHVSMLEELK